MRSEKELIQLLIDESRLFDYWNNSNLCQYVQSLNEQSYINEIEKELLLNLIRQNEPTNRYNKYYYFCPFNWQPRKEYLLNLLKKYE